MHHVIKIEQQYLDAIVEGSKTFEIRLNDRGYQKGDTVTLKGLHNFVKAKITYVTNFMQKDNVVVFGINVLKHEDFRATK